MKPSDYRLCAGVTDIQNYWPIINNMKPQDLRRLHMALGAAGEAGELCDAVKKNVFYGKDLNIKNVKEEIGDIMWYLANLLTSIDSSFEEVMAMNIDKLQKRYPNGVFTQQDAMERKDKLPEGNIT